MQEWAEPNPPRCVSNATGGIFHVSDRDTGDTPIAFGWLSRFMIKMTGHACRNDDDVVALS